MTYRKTWFSYVLWVIYTMLCAIFLVFAGKYVCASCFSGSGRLSGRAVQVLGFLTIPAMTAAYWMIRVISGRARKKYAGREKAWRILDIITVGAIFAAGILLRATYALRMIQLQNAAGDVIPENINGMEYFDMAMVTAGESVRPLAYGSAYLYVLCLSFVLSFLGNKIASAIAFQVLLQIAGIGLAYAVARKLAGRIPACTVLLYLACSAGYLEMLGNLGPECLFFVLYMAVMLAAASYVKGYCANRLKAVQASAGAAVAGILIGMLGYLDLTAVTILLVMAAIATGKKRQPENTSASLSPVMNAIAVMVVIFFCAAGFSGTCFIVSLCRGNGFINVVRNWMTVNIWNTQTSGFKPLYPYSLDMYLFGVLAVLAAFLVFEFFRSGREQDYMLWILLCIVAAPTPLAVSGVQPYGLISMYIWGVLAGLGLQNCIFGGKARFLQSMIEEINRTAEEIERADAVEETGKAETDAPEIEKAGPENAHQKTVEDEEPEITVEEIDEAVPSKAAAKPRYLDNPLPLPKKHVPKKMDYQYSVDEKDMKFDLEIKEDDDFDI